MKPDSGACAYVVTAHKSTAVTHSAVGNFTHENDLNLIVAKLTRIEVNISSDIGLKPVKEFNLYGKIAVMELFRYKVGFSQGPQLTPTLAGGLCEDYGKRVKMWKIKTK